MTSLSQARTPTGADPVLTVIRGFVQTYDWGTTDGLSGWQPAARTDAPQAELWFGDHPAGPSPLADGTGRTLADVRVDRGPLLLKILSVARPLSLQVHPDDATAQTGMPGFRTTAGTDVLVDGQGKDEMVLAITEFHLLAGFRPAAVATPMLRELGGAMVGVADVYRSRGPVAAAAAMFTLSPDDVAAITPNIAEVLASTDHHPATVNSLGRLAAMHPDDPAVLVAYTLQHRVLAPGEALHVAPGTPHAYLYGTSIEVMTNSDNVLRLGFTSKPMAIDAALTILRTNPGEIIVGAGPANDAVYYAGGAPFLMRKITRSVDLLESDHRIVLCLDGTASVHTSSGDIALVKGEALSGDDWGVGRVTVGSNSVVVIAERA